MHKCCKETMCTRCAHLPVCKYRDQFLDAQKAANNITLYGTSTEDGNTTITKLRDVPWIKPIDLVCTYFLKSETPTITNTCEKSIEF